MACAIYLDTLPNQYLVTNELADITAYQCLFLLAFLVLRYLAFTACIMNLKEYGSMYKI